MYSSDGMYAPPYSQDSAVGLVMAVGNVGSHIYELSSQMSTYLSRDGGLNWDEIHKGPFIYEFGDHGSLIVMAKHMIPTQEILYSYNEGKSWNEMQISDLPMDITNIIIEPNSISQQFVVYGTISNQNPNATSSNGVMVTIDFAGLHEPQCKGADKPGESGSDYELWSPNDGRHGSTDKCFMGQQVQYVRRKQDAECFNGEELEKKILRSFCTCT